MSSIPKRVFTSEYRAEAVKLVTEGKLGVSAAAGKLGVSVKTYANWVRQAKAGTLATIDAHRLQPVGDLQAEISRLKRELATACEERDILKKATAYFAKLSK
jgi:transposase